MKKRVINWELIDALDRIGTLEAARLFEVDPTTVRRWKRGQRIPHATALMLRWISQGKISLEDLR